MPEWYVSYAWGDDRTSEGRAREEIVDQLCNAAEARGHSILRDKEVLSLGDSISTFMRRIGSGDRVFVILSDKYLRSPHCMFELSEVWRTSRQEGKAFLERVRIYALPDANIFTPTDWTDWAIHWKQEHDALENRARQHGIVILGELGHRRLTQMRNFYTQVSDILGTLADIVHPRTLKELERYGFNDLPT
jgi:internalin A